MQKGLATAGAALMMVGLILIPLPRPGTALIMTGVELLLAAVLLRLLN